MKIEIASSEDLDQIAGLARAIWYAYFPSIISERQIEYMLSLAYTPEKMSEDMLIKQAVYLKLFEGDEFIGFVSFRPVEDKRSMLLDKLYIHPAYHRQGYGGALMSHVEHAAKDKGYERIVLAVSRFNKPAVAAYKRLGFEVVRTDVMDIGGGFTI